MNPTTPDYDKTRWASGPWDNEPDREQWSHAGFACLAVRNRLGAWCGYVGVPKDHPAYGKDYDDLDVNVHGGLTYASACSTYICHVPEPGMPDDVWWLGFDTAHCGDLVPGLRVDMPSWPGDTYKNLGYVRTETDHLAEQLRG